MAVVRLSLTIDAPPGRIFMWIADYRNAPLFIEGLEPLRPIGGSSFEAVLRMGPKHFRATITLVDVEADRLVTWAMSGKESRSLTFELTPGHGGSGGTTVEVGVSYDRPSGITGVLVGPVIDEAVRHRAGAALEAIEAAMAGSMEDADAVQPE